MHGGKDNVIEHNLFINCAAIVSFSPWDDKRWREFTAKALQSEEIDRELYLKKYPELASLAENANRNHVRSNLAWHCAELLRRAPGNLDARENVMLQDSEIIWQPGQLRMNRPGIEPIPLAEIGLYADEPLRGRSPLW
jgi:hypothetical protein